jgi:hypothetical protein
VQQAANYIRSLLQEPDPFGIDDLKSTQLVLLGQFNPLDSNERQKRSEKHLEQRKKSLGAFFYNKTIGRQIQYQIDKEIHGLVENFSKKFF